MVQAGGEAVRSLSGQVVDGERFRTWVGRSGRRHLFTRLDGGVEPVDLDGAVVIVAVVDPQGESRPAWVGAAERLPAEAAAQRRRLFAHFLAETPAARAAVIADLVGATCGGATCGEGGRLAA